MGSSAGADAALSWRSRLTLLLLLGLLGLALLAGVFARWHTLADRPLAVDEYYMVRSTEFILERGVPSFPSGGYYTRGLPLQYFMAGAATLFGPTHLSYRLPTFFFSILSIVLAYWYVRRFTPVPVSLAVALALLVSSWHIEFAGFARMYALFQCIVLLFLIAVDDAFFSGNWRRRYLPHGLAVLASLTHAIGITLIPMLFLPLVAGGPPGFRTWSERLRFGTAGLVTGLMCLGLIRGDYYVRGAGVENPLPAGYTGSAGSAFNLPVFPFWSLAGDPLTSMLLVSGLSVLALGLIWLFRRRELAAIDVWLVALMAASVAHLFALAAIAFLVLLLRYDLLEPRRHSRRVYFMLAIAVLGGVAWLGYSIAFPEALWLAAVGRWDLSEAGFLKSLWTVFFGWPDIYRSTLRPFLAEMPLTGLLVVIASAIVLLAHRHDPLSSSAAPALGDPGGDPRALRRGQHRIQPPPLLVSSLPGDALRDRVSDRPRGQSASSQAAAARDARG